MKIYKFGGASVRSAEGVANLCRIVKGEQGALFIVVSAMGKTTNALELVLEDFIGGNTASALDRLHEIEQYHREIMAGLLHQGEDFSADGISAGTNRVGALFSELGGLLAAASKRDDYDSWYDRIVSYGELISTTIVSGYLAAQGVPNRWLDMRRCFVTDSRHREANINVDRSTLLLRQAVDAFPEQVFVAQDDARAGGLGLFGRDGRLYPRCRQRNDLERCRGGTERRSEAFQRCGSHSAAHVSRCDRIGLQRCAGDSSQND